MAVVKNNYFGECLRKLRRKKKLSQKAISILAAMDQSYVAGVEAGRRPLPRERQLIRFLDALRATKEEELALRESLSLSKIEDAAREIGPNGNALVALATKLKNLDEKEMRIIEDMVSALTSH